MEFKMSRVQFTKRLNGLHDWVVANDMANLQRNTSLVGGSRDRSGILGRWRQRLLDQASHTSGKKLLGCLAVVRGGRGNRHGVDTSSEQVLDRSKGLSTPLFDNIGGALWIVINNPDQFNAIHLGVDTRMMTTHTPHTNDGTPKNSIAHGTTP
jgi:hypothetical protein